MGSTKRKQRQVIPGTQLPASSFFILGPQTVESHHRHSMKCHYRHIQSCFRAYSKFQELGDEDELS